MRGKRIEICLDGDWSFAYTMERPQADMIEFPQDNRYETMMPVPGYWDDCYKRLQTTKFWSRDCKFNPDYRKIDYPMGSAKPPDASLPYLLGTGWYRKKVKIDIEEQDAVVNLEIGGATMESWVWINGVYAGYHRGHMTPGMFDITAYLKYGEENEILIAVSNLLNDCTGCSIRGYKGKSAGITRSVKMHISRKAQITDLFVSTDQSRKKLYWSINVQNKAQDFSCKIHWFIREAVDGAVVAEGIVSEGTNWITDTFGMEEWSEKKPVLYLLEVQLQDDKEMFDNLKQMFGLRYTESDGCNILFNGKKLLLRGTTEHAYFPETCTVPMEASYYRKAFKALKERGFNWVRFHTFTPPEECLQVADELGILIQVEAVNGFLEQEFFEIVRKCRKHPSVILYCCGNEVPIDENMIDKLRRMGECCREMAPGCLYNPMEALQSVEFFMDQEADGYTEEPVPHNTKMLAEIMEFSDVTSPAVWVFSYEALCPDDERVRKKLSIFQRPCLIHEAGIKDSYLNLDLEHRYEETRIGTDLFASVRRHMKENGVLKNAAIYFRNSCKWQALTAKFTLEKARRSEFVAGYDYLGANDCHWHRSGYGVGMMNEFYESKPSFSPEECRTYNGESVILAKCGVERNFIAGSVLQVPLMVSYYGSKTLKDATLSWYWECDDHSITEVHHRKIQAIPKCCITELGDIELSVPDTTQHLKLVVKITEDAWELYNHWDYWSFENSSSEDDDNIRIAETITKDDVVYMQRGGRILLLGCGPFPSLPTKFQMMSGGRVNGNCATVIYDHPLMRRYPHEGWCDWQFYPLLENGRCIVFNELELPFDPIVEIVSSYKLIRKQAALYELSVEDGGLLICSFNMKSEDPAVGTLRSHMIKYLKSSEFKPKNKCTAEYLLKQIEKSQQMSVDFSTDECFDDGGQVEP